MAPGKQQFNLQSTGTGSSTWSGKMEDLQKLLSNLHPEKLENCSTAFSSAASKLQATAEEIYTVGLQLSTLWQGDAATKAQEQLKQLWETSQNLADTAFMVGNNLFHNHHLTLNDAPKQAPKPEHWGQGIGTAVGAGLGPVGMIGGNFLGGKWDDGHNDDLARDWVNNTLTPAAVSDNSGVPENFRTDLPDAKTGVEDPHNKPQPTFNGGGGLPHGGGGGGGGLPHGGGVPGGKLPTHPGGSLPTHPGGNLPTHPGGNLPTHPGGNLPNHGGSNLAGLHPGGGLPGGGGLGPGLSGGGGGGLGGGGLGGGLGGAGGGLGGPGLSGAGSLAAQEAAAAERAAMAATGGATGMPMGGMGGGGGGQKEERERTTWLSEDEDVWGGDGDTAPPVIG
ncbi:MAG: WXG100 family type VII secretion target [Actinoallomurus sp.]